MGEEIQSLDELRVFARKFLGTLPPQEGGATVVGLVGELGSGKTSFVQCVAHELGIEERVLSPTFVIMKTYDLRPTPHSRSFKHLVHIDAYRLERGEELEVLGWKEILDNPGNLVLVEWAEKIKEILPPSTILLSFEYVDETTRAITVHDSEKN